MGERRKHKKNRIGFTPRQLGVILDFCRELPNDSRISYSKFHRKNGTYSRKQSTIQLLNEAYRKRVLVGPYIFCNRGIEVILLDDKRNSTELLSREKRSENTTFAMTLKGDWSFFCLKFGDNSLEHVSTIIPYCQSENRVEDLMFEEPGKLAPDPFPIGWDDLDWEIYDIMGAPREVSFVNAGKKLERPWKTIQNRFNKIKRQCKTLAYFLPLGYSGYNYIFLTFRTKYEIGLANALKRLDRSSYIQKFKDMILLTLFLSPEPLSLNNVSRRFQDLEEMGIIHDLRVSIPTKWWKPNYDFPK